MEFNILSLAVIKIHMWRHTIVIALHYFQTVFSLNIMTSEAVDMK